MQTLFVYLLKVIIYSGILFTYYHIALRNKRFHYYNRFYLLMSVALSLALPFLQLQIWQLHSENPQVINLADIMITRASEPESAGHSLSLSFTGFMGLAYSCIAVCLLLSFLSGLMKLIRMKKQYPSEKVGDVLFINTDLQQAPFSFFKNLFWKNSIDISDETGKQIFRHELAHIEQKHSSDKLFLQVITLLFWINPFYWLMQKELSLIHEFIADEKAIDNKDAEAFALMLLQSQFGKNTFLPVQSFSYSPIKRRLRMLTSSSKTSYSYARRILALPVLSLSILLFAFKLSDKHQTFTVSHTNAPFVLVVDAGHGGTDNGAIGLNDAEEKGFNLSIAKKVAELAPQYGITVKMTRTEDATVSLPDRLNFIKSEQPDACISIHVDATEEKQTPKDEFTVYVTKNNAGATYGQSHLLGSSLIQSVKTNFPVEADIMQREQGIYVLDQNPYPAVILECGYMNNKKSMQILNTDAGIENIAKDILEGVVAYANNKQQTTTASPDTTAKQPLYILDGKEISAEEMKQINVNSIESINVLKDKEAIAKYGNKGENGVVLISLKKGTSSTTTPAPDSYAKALQDVQSGSFAKKLKVIDDKVVSNDEFAKLNTDNLYSVNVMDATAATRQYGDKGRNGAIVVATKKNSQIGAGYEIKPRDAIEFTGIYLLDGKEISKAELDKLPPDKIESMSVWKGEDAVKKYGDKGKNGVIEITSKNKTSSGAVLEDHSTEEVYEKAFMQTGELPSFLGGNEAWMKYLQKNLRFDALVNRKAPVGTYTVTVSFQVDTDGSLSHIKAVTDPGFGTAEEAIRVIQNGPKWIPAKQNGHDVAAVTRQPVTFVIS